MRSRYAIQAVLVYVAIGVALGMIAWALLIHDSGDSSSPSTAVPVQTNTQR
jgi:hypothetical protein